jgi:hypothetical protein
MQNSENIDFFPAKNGELTVTINSTLLHSKYNPSKEAENYIKSLNISFIPKIFFVIEPALSYVANSLKKCYPTSKIIAIRFTNIFDKYNLDYEETINLNNFKNNNEIENYFYLHYTEELLFNSIFVDWKPTAILFHEENLRIWKIINKIMKQCQSILTTRAFFEKKWLVNSITNLCNILSFASIKNQIDLPIFITASGPSLYKSLNFLKQNRDKLFILSVSSSLSTLLYYKIIPDLCISTDGGWWAGKHLKKLTKKPIPLALAVEGYCPKEILQNNDIFLLTYKDGLSSNLSSYLNKNNLTVDRNGTVSGTALSLATKLSNNNIFFCGLDLATQKGNQHCNPNELNNDSSIQYNRLSSAEKKVTISQYSNNSLEIYCNWFRSQEFKNRKIFRIIDSSEAKNTLNNIVDISIDDLQLSFDVSQQTSKNVQFEKIEISIDEKKELKKEILHFINNTINSEESINQLYPIESIMKKRSTVDKMAYYNSIINNKHQELLKKIRNIINE